VDETALRAGDAQRIRVGEHLNEHRFPSPPQLMSERRDAQHVVEVDDELVVPIGEGHVARQPALRAPGLHHSELAGTPCLAERPQFGRRDGPAGAAQHEPSADHPRQEGCLLERTPIPRERRCHALALQGTQEAVHAQIPPVMVVGGGEPRHDFPPQVTRAQHDAVLAHGHQQVGDGNPMVGRHAGATEVGNLVIAQHGTAQDVADPAVGKMHDLGEQPLGVASLLRRYVGAYERVQGRVGVAEAAEQKRARRAAQILQEHAEGAVGDGAIGLGRQHGHHIEGIGKWTTLRRGQRI
jgi:hypothetical protein